MAFSLRKSVSVLVHYRWTVPLPHLPLVEVPPVRLDRASQVPVEVVGLQLYLLVPQTSDHLFNLEQDPVVILWTPGWALKGEAQVGTPAPESRALKLLQEAQAQWCMLVRVDPWQVQLRRKSGWGSLETIDLKGY
jgi:hypothetical protein